MAKTEQYTEKLILTEMKSHVGENSFGYVYPQGDIENVKEIDILLQKAGGKPDVCELKDYLQGGNGKAKPEFIVTFSKKTDTIIVVECKRDVKNHRSENLSSPQKFAVDGALYYAKFLKEKYNVIVVAISGTSKNNFKANTFYWIKNAESYYEYKKATDIILEPENYLKLVNGEKIQKDFSLVEIRETAILMNNTLREIKLTEKHKPIFIAGILIALASPSFAEEYETSTTFKTLSNRLKEAIEEKLKESEIKQEKIENILKAFDIIDESPKLKEIPLYQDNSLMWYIKELEMKIKPMMDYSNSSLDALSVFYHEFIRYSGGDGNGLGIVLTPQHLADFMCEVVGVDKNSKVIDICCGSGSFLVSAMSKMFKNANIQECDKIKKEQLYGIELDSDLYTLAVSNMIVRGDGKSNLYHADCFNDKVNEKTKKTLFDELKEKNLSVGLINPPYSQKDFCELEFVERLLSLLVVGGKACVVVPVLCATGTKFKIERERLFKKHTLLAVFSMPNDIFYPKGTNVCVMLWEAHKPHNSEISTFFGYYKDDGYVKAKKLGRIDKFEKWENIKTEWVKLYNEREIKAGLTIKKFINWNNEWLAEAYMETDFTKLKQENFEKIVQKYMSSLIFLYNNLDLKSKFKIEKKDFKLNTNKWKNFKIGDIFECKLSKGDLKENECDNGDVLLIPSGTLNNGVVQFIDKEGDGKAQIFNGNCITVDMFCQAFYQEKDFYAVSHGRINILIPKFNLNKYIALFICVIINNEKYRFQYGRAVYSKVIENLIIKLPVDNQNNPDFEFMENYIKQLPYSDKI